MKKIFIEIVNIVMGSIVIFLLLPLALVFFVKVTFIFEKLFNLFGG